MNRGQLLGHGHVLSMIADDLDLLWSLKAPPKYDPPLVVYSDRMFACEIASQGSRRRADARLRQRLLHALFRDAFVGKTASPPRHIFPHPPPVGVIISTASPAATSVCAQPGRTSIRPSLRRMEFWPSSPGSPPIAPGLGTARWPERIATRIGFKKRMRLRVPSPAFHRPLPPEPRRIAKSSSTTGKRLSSTSGSVRREFVIWVCTAAGPSKFCAAGSPEHMVS